MSESLSAVEVGGIGVEEALTASTLNTIKNQTEYPKILNVIGTVSESDNAVSMAQRGSVQ
jgi:hypothetical protein